MLFIVDDKKNMTAALLVIKMQWIHKLHSFGRTIRSGLTRDRSRPPLHR